ncbi:peptidoglycan D,D-transpeptidase FtsI family protein [Patescibacteria group bacterium]
MARLNFLLFVFFLVGALILARLFYWQVLSFEELTLAAEQQHFISFEVPAVRGRILASDSFPLVNNKAEYLVFASLSDLKESPQRMASQLSPLLATEAAQLETEIQIKDRLGREDLVWVPINPRVSPQTKESIEDLNLSGIGFEEVSARDYPEGSSSAHLLGFVGSDASGRDKGYFGIEGFYDWQLRGKAGMVRQEKDALGRPILVGKFGQESSSDGRDLVLFLDRAVQFMVEEKLKIGLEKTGAKAGSVIVMDPKTGGILALTAFPAYHPQEYAEYESKLFKNPVVADLFEPGSILKPIIMASALNEGVVKSSTKCDRCSGPRFIGGYKISTFDDQYFPDSTTTEIIERSDNIGMVFVAEELGIDQTYRYLNDFGFSEKTGIDLEEETTNELRPREQWREIDLATASFGQGVAFTRIQLVRAFSALANEGKIVVPRMVNKIIADGREIKANDEKDRQVVKSSVAKVVTEMLVSATEKSPLHFPRDRIPGLKGYRIAAKSGTAEIPVAGEYDPEKTIASVIGFAPADNPRFVILVSLVEPSAKPWGSDTAGPIFFEILSDLFLYYGIQPG